MTFVLSVSHDPTCCLFVTCMYVCMYTLDVDFTSLNKKKNLYNWTHEHAFICEIQGDMYRVALYCLYCIIIGLQELHSQSRHHCITLSNQQSFLSGVSWHRRSRRFFLHLEHDIDDILRREFSTSWLTKVLLHTTQYCVNSRLISRSSFRVN